MHSYTKSCAQTQFAALAGRLEGNPLCRVRVRQCFPGSQIPVAFELEILATSIARAGGGPGSPATFRLDRRWWRFGVLLEDVPHSVIVAPADLDLEHPHLTPIGCCLTRKDEMPFPDLSTVVRRLYLSLTYQLLEPKDCLNDRRELADFIAQARDRGDLPTDRRPLDAYTPSLGQTGESAEGAEAAPGDPYEIVVEAETIEETA